MFRTTAFSFTFTTRAKDTKAPSTVYQYPAGTLMKYTIDPVAPYVLFSEGITAHASKYVTFKDGASSQYKLTANDATCGTTGTTASACVEVDALLRGL